MKKAQRSYHPVYLLSVACAIMIICSYCQERPAATKATHSDLISLFKIFDQLRHPKIVSGIPDYSANAMTNQFDSLKILQDKLSRMDTAGWAKDEQIDYRLVEAHMHGLEFNHRIMRRWSRDPSFYSVIGWFNPTMEGAIELPELPLPEKGITEFRNKLEMMPGILAAAKINLTEMTPDFATLGIKRQSWQEEQLTEWLPQLGKFHPDLVKPAEKVIAAISDFRKWLESKAPSLTGSSGIGVDNYNWLLKNVYLFPYTWDQCVLLTQRELERSLVFLKMEEFRNRNLPPLHLITERREFDSVYLEGQLWLIRFIRENDILPQPDYLKVTAKSNFGSGTISRPTGRNFFENVLDRDPLPLLPHDMVGHSPDAAREKEWNNRPIPRAWDPFYVSGIRAEALATDMEENLMNLGMLDKKPRSRELTLMLRVFRAVRALEDLKMASNEFSLDQAMNYAMNTVPYGWYNKNTYLIWEETDLYLRQPGYGIGYLMGSIQMEELIAKRALKLGTEFHIQKFMKEFLDPGLIPISLIEMSMN